MTEGKIEKQLRQKIEQFLDNIADVERTDGFVMARPGIDPKIKNILDETREQSEKIIRRRVEKARKELSGYLAKGEYSGFAENFIEELGKELYETIQGLPPALRMLSYESTTYVTARAEAEARAKKAELRADRAEEEIRKYGERKGRRRTREQLHFDFGELAKRNNIPLDIEMFDNITELVPDRLTKYDLIEDQQLDTGETLKIYQREVGSTKFVYRYFIPEGVDSSAIPTLGEKARSSLMLMVLLAQQQESNVVEFTRGQMLEAMGYTEQEIRRGGKTYTDLDNAIHTMVYGTYEKEDKQRGKKYRKEIGHILNRVVIDGKGRGATIIVDIPPDKVSTALSFAEGNSPDKKYIGIPKKLAMIKGTGLDGYQKKYLLYLSALSGLKSVYPIQVVNLLTRKLNISKTLLKNMGKEKIKDLLGRILTAGKKEGLLKTHEIDYMSKPKDPLMWKLKQYVATTIEAGEEATTQKPTEEIIDITGMLGWLTKPSFKVRTSPETVQQQLERTIKKYGFDEIKMIFDQEANALTPHPKNFWNRIKELKKSRKPPKLFDEIAKKSTAKKPKSAKHLSISEEWLTERKAKAEECRKDHPTCRVKFQKDPACNYCQENLW
ncbi:hypothetical protein ES702_04980 [subsurface metagenome]